MESLLNLEAMLIPGNWIGTDHLADCLDSMPRRGTAVDVPEGSRYVVMSDTLLKLIPEAIRREHKR